jgi:hypothetical protein
MNTKEQDVRTMEVSVPTYFTGTISKLSGPSVCNDGATHEIRGYITTMRLKEGIKGIEEQLDSHADTGPHVTVGGLMVMQARCMHLKVFYVAPVEETLRKLIGKEQFGTE